MTDQSSYNPIHDEPDGYRDSIATVTKDGKRIWLRPEQPKGAFYDKRKLLSYALLVVLFGLPFVEIGGEPLFLFDVLGRQFRIFGIGFSPQDTHLAGLMMITMIVAIAMFTVIFGRLFCGWICPQTIFMEMVFRRIEYAIDGTAAQQRRLDKAPWDGKKIRKRLLKHSIFFFIAVLISHVFLSYIIGWREVARIASEPVSEHLAGFTGLVVFSGVFYGVFARLREQVCTSICPYGRMQSVLVDPDTVGVSYDFVRGEPRGKLKRKNKKVAPLQPSVTALATGASLATDINVADKEESPIKLGDCIDCSLCVRVCPTGIDIRDGNNQLECVHCTACIDACDDIMDKVGKPRGLIRYDSLNGLKGQRKPLLTKRAYAYAAVLLVLISLNSFLLIGRAPLEATIVRTAGMLHQEPRAGVISNLYNYQFYNKSNAPMEVTIRVAELEYATVKFIGKPPVVEPRAQARGSFFVELPKAEVTQKSTKFTFEVLDANNQVIDTDETTFLGPTPGL